MGDVWHSHGLLVNELLSSCIRIFYCPGERVKSLKWMTTYFIFMFSVWSLITDGVKIQFQFSIVFPQDRADCVARELWSGLVGWRHSVCSPLNHCSHVYSSTKWTDMNKSETSKRSHEPTHFWRHRGVGLFCGRGSLLVSHPPRLYF